MLGPVPQPDSHVQALKAVDAGAEADIRWSATLHFKLSLPLELRGDVDAAAQHINTAAAQLKYLTKQVRSMHACLMGG